MIPGTGSPTRDRTVRNTVLAAAVIAFAIDLLLQPPRDVANAIGRAIVFPLAVGVYFLIGWWLGTRTWPKRGRKLARRALQARLREKRHILFLSDRPDFEVRTARRVWEVVGFAAGASVLVASILILLGLGAATVPFILFFTWASFVLVPFWLFARLGIRQIDPMRWLILPVSRRYADRLKLSNGALVLLGLGAMVNAALRGGSTPDQAIVDAILAITRIVGSVLVIAATAVAYYARREHALVRELEAEVIELGVRDGRAMSDGDFLPGLPPPKQRYFAEPMMDLKIKRD